MKKTIQVITMNGLVLLGLMIVVELIFGSWFEPKKFHGHIIRRNVQDTSYSYYWNYRSKLTEARKVVYTRDKYGFRGESIFNQPENINILVIGGSTTDELEVTDSQTWTALLEKKWKKSFDC